MINDRDDLLIPDSSKPKHAGFCCEKFGQISDLGMFASAVVLLKIAAKRQSDL